jgi:hypothetical protein
MAVAPFQSIDFKTIVSNGKCESGQCPSFQSGKIGLTVSYPRRTRIRKAVAYRQMTRRGIAYLWLSLPMLTLRNWKKWYASTARNPSTIRSDSRLLVVSTMADVVVL